MKKKNLLKLPIEGKGYKKKKLIKLKEKKLK